MWCENPQDAEKYSVCTAPGTAYNSRMSVNHRFPARCLADACYRRLFGAALILLAGIPPGVAAAPPAGPSPDLAREERLRTEIVDTILDGAPVDLAAGGRPFLALYTEAAKAPPHGGVILLHGRGFHPDWGQVIQPLRVALPAHGWNTLSIQLPVLDKEATYYDYVPILGEAAPRIEAAIDFLRSKGLRRIVLIAHSCGAHMAMRWFEINGDQRISGFAGLGLGATDFGQPMERPFPLERMKVPVLDLYGSEEYPAVLRGAPQRRAAILRAGHPKSRQQVIAGANHYFEGIDNALLIEAVRRWLDSL